ncbi:MAG: hemolysin family protein [Acidobacteriota bacterium]|nr:hemolysin family protein [Acidobacteriota bacterium]
MLELALVVGLVVLTSSACSLFEAVLYSVPLSQIDALERAGKPSGPLLRTLRSQVDRPIAAILSLNTIANTGGAALAGAIASSVLGSVWIGYFSGAFTLAILLLSEIIPKTAGVVYASRLAGPLARPIMMLVKICAPIIWVSRLITQLVATRNETDRVSDEDLLLMVRRGLRSGDLQPHEADVISNVLALEVKTAAQVMTPRTVLFALHSDITLAEAAADDHLLRHSRVPVYEDNPDDVIGIVHRRDILDAAAKDQFETSLEQLMRPVHFVVETVKLDQLLRTFLEQRQHLVVVTDEFGSVSGIVTLEDVLEEILGREIVDEFDQVVDLRAFARQQRASQPDVEHLPARD